MKLVNDRVMWKGEPVEHVQEPGSAHAERTPTVCATGLGQPRMVNTCSSPNKDLSCLRSSRKTYCYVAIGRHSFDNMETRFSYNGSLKIISKRLRVYHKNTGFGTNKAPFF